MAGEVVKTEHTQEDGTAESTSLHQCALRNHMPSTSIQKLQQLLADLNVLEK